MIPIIFATVGAVLASVNVPAQSRKLDSLANLFCGAAATTLVFAYGYRFYVGFPPVVSLYEMPLLVALFLELFEFVAFLFCKVRTFDLIVPVSWIATILMVPGLFFSEASGYFLPTVQFFVIALGCTFAILSLVVFLLHHFRPGEARRRLMYRTLVLGLLLAVAGTLLGFIPLENP